MISRLRAWSAVALVATSVVGVGVPAGTAGATGGRHLVAVKVAVVDEDGGPRQPATVMACPYRAGAPDCTALVAGPTNRRGVARLQLDSRQRYEFTAFVRDPDPPWACPGFDIDGSDYYFAEDPFSARPREVPRRAALTIVEPVPSDCAPPPDMTAEATVRDGAGAPLPAAGLFICPLAADGTPCPGPSFDGPDPDGTIRFDVDPGVTYRLSAFIVNTGWPCPGYVGPNGDTFHFSAEADYLGAVLAATTTTFVVREPMPEECAGP